MIIMSTHLLRFNSAHNHCDASSASPAVIVIIMSTRLLHLKSQDNHHDASSASPVVMMIKPVRAFWPRVLRSNLLSIFCVSGRMIIIATHPQLQGAMEAAAVGPSRRKGKVLDTREKKNRRRESIKYEESQKNI